MQLYHMIVPLLVLDILQREGSPIAGHDLILKSVHLGADLLVRDEIHCLMRLGSLSLEGCQLKVQQVYELHVPLNEFIWRHSVVPSLILW